MTSFIANQFTRITTAATWTEIAGATKGLSGFASGDVAELDVLVQNFDADEAEVLVAVTATSTAPAADTDAFYRASLAQYAKEQLQVILTGTEHLWVKTDQTDVRVIASGTTEDN